nr:hypothetical protein CFP56_44406 [Quercus suber]
MNRLTTAAKRFLSLQRTRPSSQDTTSTTTDQHASLLGNGEKPDENNGHRPTNKFFGTASGKRILIATIALLSFLIVLGSLRHHIIPAHGALPTPQFIHVLVPTTRQKNDVDLCKTIISSHILNYPVPTLIDWGVDEQGVEITEKRRVHHKFLRIYQWLNKLPETSDTGLVILLDGPNTWFQLRPEVLIQRYWDATRRADKRLKKTYNARTKQKIMFPAVNECAPSKENDVACFAVPKPVSGGNTEARYLGNGAIVGTTLEVRLLLHRALEKSQNGAPSDPSEIFGDIFGEQEYQREITRRSHWWWMIWKWFESGDDVLAVVPGRKQYSDAQGTFEHGIGLDYDNELGFVSSFGDGPVEWKKSNSLPQDIQQSMTPFWTLAGSQAGLPHGSDWSSVDLLSRKDTHTVPAMIHHTTPSKSSAAGLREQWWPHLWLQPYARILFSGMQTLPTTVMATATDKWGETQQYWNIRPLSDRDGVWLADGNFTYWPYMCNDEEDADVMSKELFRDDEVGGVILKPFLLCTKTSSRLVLASATQRDRHCAVMPCDNTNSMQENIGSARQSLKTLFGKPNVSCHTRDGMMWLGIIPIGSQAIYNQADMQRPSFLDDSTLTKKLPTIF